MKISVLSIIFALLCSNMVFAQKQKTKSKIVDSIAVQSNHELEIAIYNMAMEYGDIGVAINSLYSLIAKNPGNLSYKDSLAHIYFQTGSYNQCLRVCEDLNKTKPMDTIILRMMAMSHQSTGYSAEAIAELETVVKITGCIVDIYQKAAIEYSIKRLQESKMSIEAVIDRANDNNKIILFGDKDKKQEVPLKAAAYNLYGMIAKDFNDTANARLLFLQAIKLYPDFYYANLNLNALSETTNKKPSEQAQANNNSETNAGKKK